MQKAIGPKFYKDLSILVVGNFRGWINGTATANHKGHKDHKERTKAGSTVSAAQRASLRLAGGMVMPVSATGFCPRPAMSCGFVAEVLSSFAVIAIARRAELSA